VNGQPEQDVSGWLVVDITRDNHPPDATAVIVGPDSKPFATREDAESVAEQIDRVGVELGMESELGFGIYAAPVYRWIPTQE
jgi:hypothetical protein